jgi:hypothetical protein
LSSIDNASHSMEVVVLEDSPLAGYLEGLAPFVFRKHR